MSSPWGGRGGGGGGPFKAEVFLAGVKSKLQLQTQTILFLAA